MQPSAEKILSVLVDLYAKQMGVKIEYVIEGGKNEKDFKVNRT